MNPEKQREIARKGGKSAHKTPRGFAAMSAKKRKKIASKGGKISRGGGRPKIVK